MEKFLEEQLESMQEEYDALIQERLKQEELMYESYIEYFEIKENN